MKFSLDSIPKGLRVALVVLLIYGALALVTLLVWNKE
jgi:hypothetical protein